MIRFGRCQCCEALRSEVDFLRSLVRPKSLPKFESLPTVTLEADALISGNDYQTEITHEEQQRQEEIDSERAKLLSGNY